MANPTRQEVLGSYRAAASRITDESKREEILALISELEAAPDPNSLTAQLPKTAPVGKVAKNALIATLKANARGIHPVFPRRLAQTLNCTSGLACLLLALSWVSAAPNDLRAFFAAGSILFLGASLLLVGFFCLRNKPALKRRYRQGELRYDSHPVKYMVSVWSTVAIGAVFCALAVSLLLLYAAEPI